MGLFFLDRYKKENFFLYSMRNWCTFILCIFVLGGAFAYPGVSPGSYELDFESNLEKNFSFRFFLAEGARAEINVTGSLAEYLVLDKSLIEGSEVVIATLKFPNKIEVPGDHRIYISAKDIIENSEGISLAMNARSFIRVKVPYPGKYAEPKLDVSNANTGEPVQINLMVFSKGDEDINVKAYLDVFDFSNKLIETHYIGESFIESTKSKEFIYSLDTKGYVSGDYNASIRVEYGGEKPSLVSKIFRLGILFVDIVNYTSEFEKNKINRMNIEIESFWNEPIGEIYAEVSLVGYDESFRTLSVNLDPWKRRNIVGYLDSSKIDKPNFQANITLFYENSTTTKLVELSLIEEVNYLMYVVYTILLIIILIVLINGYRYIRRNYKLVKNVPKR